MALASLFVVAFVGSVLWVVNPELTAIYYASELAYPVWVVALVCAAAQTLMYTLLFLGGERLRARWQWLRRRSEDIIARYGQALERRFLVLAGLGAAVGVPPASILSAVAPSFSVRVGWLVAIVFVARVVRFTVLGVAGNGLVAWLRGLL